MPGVVLYVHPLIPQFLHCMCPQRTSRGTKREAPHSLGPSGPTWWLWKSCCFWWSLMLLELYFEACWYKTEKNHSRSEFRGGGGACCAPLWIRHWPADSVRNLITRSIIKYGVSYPSCIYKSHIAGLWNQTFSFDTDTFNFTFWSLITAIIWSKLTIIRM